jgi:hypothetical protein
MNKEIELELELELEMNKLSLNVFPLRVLPLNILRVISDYSKPLTRPDWRICGKIRLVEFVECINTTISRLITNNKFKSLIKIVDTNFKQSQMYIIGNDIYINGLTEYLMNTKDNLSYICNQPYLMLQHEYSYINLNHKRRLRENFFE